MVQTILRGELMKHILIVGHGFVGKAVEHGFTTSNCQVTVCDPKYNVYLDDLLDTVRPGESRFDATFVCVPTPYGEGGTIDDSIVNDVVELLTQVKASGIIVVKSTVTPDVIGKLANLSKRVVYNPEFLTEGRAFEDFVNPRIHVFGGEEEVCKQIEHLYKEASKCKPCPSIFVSPEEASFIKYGINCFLATKVLWFNQFKDIIDMNGSNYHKIINAIGTDPRVGFSHTSVPGFDGRKGFGGACFPKDTSAFSHYAEGVFTVLDEVIEANKAYRCAYSLDDREKEQKITYE